MMTTEERNEASSERIYQNAMLLIQGKLYSEASDELARIPGYRDADEQKAVCDEKKQNAWKDAVYAEADKAAANANVRSQQKAIAIFQRISGYRDVDERIEQATRRIEEIRQKEKEDREEAIRAAREAERKAKLRKKRIIRIALITAAAAALCAVGVFLFRKYAVPEIRYRRAVAQIEAGEYDDAYRTLHGMAYKDSSEQVARIAKERLRDAEVGSTVLFGSYPQGHIRSDEKSPIEWIVLDRQGDSLLLISRYALDCLPFMPYSFYQDNVPATWETSLMREWLNDSFLQTAFDPGEVQMITRSKVWNDSADGSQDSRTTTDRVFLLSADEAVRYFSSDEARKCTATQFAIEYGAYRSSIGGTCIWWLRTPGDDSVIVPVVDPSADYAATRFGCIGTSGEIIRVGYNVLERGNAVRPVIRVNLAADEALPVPKK